MITSDHSIIEEPTLIAIAIKSFLTIKESHSKEEMGNIFTNAYGQATSISQVV